MMKKTVLFFAVALVLLGCNAIDEKPVVKGGEKITLFASIDASSRLVINTSDDETFNHFWQVGDQIKVFDGTGNAADFDLDGYDALSPSNAANFTGTFGYTPAGAVYPADNASAAFDGTEFTVTFPGTQAYTDNSYDPAANVYVATCSGTTLSFQPISCYLRVALWSTTASTTVDHMVISSIAGEKIAGLASVTTAGEITMDPSAVPSITLNCGTGVTLSNNSANPTYFYIAIPAVDLSKGLKVDVYKSDGTHLWRNVSVSPLVKKNRVLKMGILEYSPIGASSATLKSGGDVNSILKHLSGDDTTAVQGYNVENTSITKIVLETSKNMTGVKNGTEGTDYLIISEAASPHEIVATFKDGIARIQTAADTIVAGSASYLFMNMRGVISYEGLDSHFAIGTNSFMNYMFRDNRALTSLDLSKITIYNQASAKRMIHMFYYCSSLTTLTLWSDYMFTRDCRQMFYNCSSLETLNNSNKIYSSSSLTTTERMFYGCEKLTALSFSKVNFKISNVTKMGSMFKGCKSLTVLDVSGFETGNVTSMDSLFFDCDALTSIDLRTFDTRKVTTMQYLCNDCDNLTSLDLSGANCSTQSMSTPEALKNLICNTKKMTTLKLGDNFQLGASRFATGIHYLMLPNPSAVTATLTIYANASIATSILQQVGKPNSNYRAVEAVKAGKLNFKSLDGSKAWRYYSDSGLTVEQPFSDVTNGSYVGLSGD